MLWQLFLGFLKVGCFSFGGAYSAIPIIREVVLSNGWMTDEMLSYMLAVSESTPGPIMVNLATYIGANQAGLLGAALATFSVVLPAFVIILLVLVALRKLLENPAFNFTLRGLKACASGIIFATGAYMAVENAFSIGQSIFDWKALIVSLVLAAVLYVPRLYKKKVGPIVLIGIGALCGILAYSVF